MAEDRIIVRPAQASDIPALKRVLQETFEGTWLPNVTEAAAQRYIETDIGGRYVDRSWPEFAVAEIDGAVAGLIHWRADFIEALHVMASRQGQGVGRKLLSYAEQAIGATGSTQVRLETDTFNLPAQALYKAVGYVEKNRYPDDEWDSGFTTVLFEKRL
ncbi:MULTISPECIES: N-acetyltransferase [unclassified Mesorhizobium]|uniref:GNAT family N-acetyltransferase n=1 Tax=unclassified Mesorhizobium TaxID=325217 RepID=UPI000F74D600|nr:MULTISPECIES: N-acetyltransferase [unclassified Mesorhizobium]AZO40797.1 N-acetyltransferase [Mesorhizobium sp. M7D.F.Ca.US.005.01.1.1]RUX96554.1 GNAT family N-acetyltransferase [Mesorhizobium sp. M7D.F.Ca.US.004.01.2.1]RVA28751.1 GNAT family N-acetyltransferase [Mesorhizobium sp. M7D.F.Ca.US.004.03.1.1]